MKKKIDLEKILMIFIIIQPFLDFYLLYSEQITNIFKFSPTTIIRMVFVAFFIIYLLFKINYNKKYFWILGYLVLIFIYLIFHVLNSLNFNISIGDNLIFSYITEAFYFIRLIIPILLIFITYKINIKDETFRKSIVVVSLICSLEIIITNIFKISLTSYGGDSFIAGNIFDWFINKSYTFEQLASKGFFYMANQISVLLIMLLPINIYYALKTSKKICVFSSITLSLSLIMLGTRVGTYGWILISLVAFIAWIFFGIIHKNKIGITTKKVIVYIIINAILIFISLNSPLIIRQTFTDYELLEKENLTDEINDKLNNLKTEEEMKEFIVQYNEYYSIPLEYIKDLYSFENDYKFWIDIMKLPYSIRGGNRNLENLITKRIYELNNNEYDKFLGMGYSRFRKAKIYIEQDVIVHYYTIGIFGVILFLLPCLAVATFAIIYMLVKHKLKMKPTILCISIYITYAVSIFSGHVLDELIVTIILGYISGYLLTLIFNNEEDKNMKFEDFINDDYDENNPKVSIIVPVYNVEQYLRKCLDSLVNQTLKNIEIIVINDGTKDNSQDIIDEYSKKYKNVIAHKKENGGVANTRNYGLKHAKGKYIGFVDSDDYVSLDMFEKLYKKAISNDFDVSICNLKYIYETKTVNRSSNVEQDLLGKEEIKDSIINIYPVLWNKIYKKSLFTKNNITFKEGVWFEDVELLLRLYPYINSIGYVDDAMYMYLQRSGSITNTFDKRLYDYIDNFNGIVKFYKNRHMFKEYKDELEYSYVRYLFATFIKGTAKFKDKEEFVKACDAAIINVNKNFPNYKDNKYIKKFTLKNLYLRYFNQKLANIIFMIRK